LVPDQVVRGSNPRGLVMIPNDLDSTDSVGFLLKTLLFRESS